MRLGAGAGAGAAGASADVGPGASAGARPASLNVLVPGSRLASLYVLAASADLLAVALHWSLLGWVAKPLLAPLLALALVRAGVAGRSPMPLGLVCAAIGDIALMFPGTGAFIVGMAAFLAMQVFYIRAFRQFGTGIGRRASIAYTALWLIANAILLPRAGALAPAIAIYSAALVTMAASARRLGPIAAAGGALFVVSDALIGAGIGGAGFPGRAFATMTTYVVAQALLVYAYANAHSRAQVPPDQRARAVAGVAFAAVASGNSTP